MFCAVRATDQLNRVNRANWQYVNANRCQFWAAPSPGVALSLFSVFGGLFRETSEKHGVRSDDESGQLLWVRSGRMMHRLVRSSPANAGITGSLGRDLRHEIPGQARDGRLGELSFVHFGAESCRSASVSVCQ